MTAVTLERIKEVAEQLDVEVVENSENPGFYIERTDRSYEKLSVEDLVSIVLGEMV